MKNKLTTYASACSLGFLFSFIPIVLILMIVLMRFLNASPDVIFKFIDLTAIFVDPEKIKDIAQQITSPEKTTMLTIILVISIFWMCQKFFFSIENGIQTIFHLGPAIKHRPAFEKMILVLSEIIIVVVVTLLLFIFVTARSIFSKQSFISKIVIPYFPHFLVSWIKAKFFYFLPYLFIFLLSAIMYKFASGSKPTWKACFLAAAICTIIFFGATRFLSIFLNRDKYNLVYGVLSSLIIVLLEVYIFFVLFFISAQAIFVYQFFDSLLLGEVYLWQPAVGYNIKELIKQILFAFPSKLISEKNPRLNFDSDNRIYNKDSPSDGIYYIVEGAVKMYKENYVCYVEAGDFFGDYDCILDRNRSLNAITTSKTTLIFINKNQFDALIESNPEVSQKIVENINSYIFKVYGSK